MELRPQPGPQEKFLATSADIAIYGGAAGGGKSYALLMEPLRHISNNGFGAVIFRHNANQIMAEGGLWDTSSKIYPWTGARSSKNPAPTWTFPGGAKVSFAHLEYEKDRLKWQGSQITMIGFDELTHFSKSQFFYMLSRNRSVCGVRPYVRATTNPDADSWVAEFIEWWIDQDTGYPIPERSGVLRYMVQLNDALYWGDSPEELVDKTGCKVEHVKSVTFIASKLSDNKILMENDPGYEANLNALSEVEKERLLNGNWKIKPAAGLVFPRSKANFIEALPKVVRWVRGWDLAATDKKEKGENGKPACTAGVLMGKTYEGRIVVADVFNKAYAADDVRKAIKATCIMDKQKYKRVRVRLPQDPGQAGKEQAASYIKMLAGFNVTTELESGSKETRAEPFAAQWQHGNVDILVAPWNEEYISQLENFPEGKLKDMVDASSSAFNELEKANTNKMPGSIDKVTYWR
ncbi:MAG: phage terminase large subunit [bacterium]|nr:phage terminase large subunit [bacterium]